jgi:hypothetical protein
MAELKHNRENFYKIEIRTPMELKNGEYVPCEQRWGCFPEPWQRHHGERLPFLYAPTKEKAEEVIDVVLSIPFKDRPNPLGEAKLYSPEHYAAERAAGKKWTEIFKSRGVL